MRDRIRIAQADLTAYKNKKVKCKLEVTPHSDDPRITVYFEITGGGDCFFVTPKGNVEKVEYQINSGGARRRIDHEVELCIGTRKSGVVGSRIRAFTDNSDKTDEIRMTLRD